MLSPLDLPRVIAIHGDPEISDAAAAYLRASWDYEPRSLITPLHNILDQLTDPGRTFEQHAATERTPEHETLARLDRQWLLAALKDAVPAHTYPDLWRDTLTLSMTVLGATRYVITDIHEAADLEALDNWFGPHQVCKVKINGSGALADDLFSVSMAIDEASESLSAILEALLRGWWPRHAARLRHPAGKGGSGRIT